jgi:predicted esterase
LGAGPFALAVLLVGVAQTWRGHLFGVVGAGLVAAPVLVLVRRSRALAVGCGFALVLGLGGLVAAVPSPRAPAQHGAWAEGPPQLGLPTLLPEIDQLVLGTYLIGFVDPLITVAGSRHVREAFLSVYRPMLADPQFAALPTQLTQAYRGTTEPQRFVYVPEHAPGERLPCVVFLHGSAGNFQGYLWLWKQLADRGHFVVVAPGFGFGNWQRPGGVDAVREARREAERTLPVDPARFVLAGLSNGGRGVMRVIEEDPGRTWKAVVLLSAVVDLEPSPEAWADRPTLVVHGLRDDRISAHWLDVSVDLLRRAGAQVSLKTDPDEDHFLVFSRPEEVSGWVLEFLTPWLGPVEAHAPRGPP